MPDAASWLPGPETAKQLMAVLAGLARSIEPVWEVIHANPETGYEEKIASAALAQWLGERGFLCEMAVAGMATAFQAQSGQGPKIIYMAEYDALPGLGHACGHSLSGVASALAAAALAKSDVNGQVCVLGTPAEEGVVPNAGGKLRLIEAGAFKDAICAMMAHAYTETVLEPTVLARVVLDARWLGRAAHAGAEPHKGKNALTAAILGLNAVNSLYQQLRAGCRINSILRSGGTVVNTIPDLAEASLQLRAPDMRELNALVKKIENCLQSGGLAAGCQTVLSFPASPVADLRSSNVLVDIYSAALEWLGVPFVRKDPALCISTDAGSVSHELPTIHSFFDIFSQQKPPLHSREFASECARRGAWNGMIKAASALCLTGYAVLANPTARAQLKKEFGMAEGVQTAQATCNWRI